MSEEGAAEAGGEAAAAPVSASEVLGVEATPEAGGGQTAPESEWHNGMNLSGDTVQLFEAKGWHKHENPLEALSQGYRNLERLRGVPGDQLVRVPEPGNEEQMAEFRARMGVPDSPEGYELPAAEVNGVALDTSVLASVAHALDATPEKAARLPGIVSEILQSSEAERVANFEAAAAAMAQNWRSAQGDKFEENTLHADRGFDAMKIDQAMVDAVRSIPSEPGQKSAFETLMDAAVMVGRLTSEARPGYDGESGGDAGEARYGLTVEVARRLVKEEGPELTRKARAGDAAAKARYENLKQVAFHS